MRIGSEEYKFYIKSSTGLDEHALKNCPAGKARHAFRVHPDGGYAGTAGCIGLPDVTTSRQVRSCLQWIGQFGCAKVPLTVSYFGA
jgi:hypothetical protein